MGKCKDFTLLEDLKPTNAFLNIESSKMGYNEIDKLKINDPKNPNTKIETTDQKVIRDYTKSFYQKIYNEQHKVTPTQDDIKNFLQMDDDNSPWENFLQRKLPKEMADSMEGDLTMDELQEALFKHMNGSSSPGMDGFTVNYLRAFWPDLKFITLEALNAIQADGLSQTLRGAILKLLRKGEKDPLEIGNYRPISLLSIFYKLASCCITQRIKPEMENLTVKQQKVYIDKNNICSCIFNLLNLMKHVNKKSIY